MTQTALTRDAIDPRIVFHDADQIMEVSLEDLTLDTAAGVNLLFDRIEERIHDTGEEKWFFLMNYSGARIDYKVWVPFGRRGRDLNEGHSQGTARFDASDITKKQIERAAGTEAYDPSLFDNRDAALAHLRELPSQRRRRIVHEPSFGPQDVLGRVTLQREMSILEIDFSDLEFRNSLDVDTMYDVIEDRISDDGQKWFFLINYENTRIDPAAWVRFSLRGTKLAEARSLGTVRYAPGSETEKDIRLRMQGKGIRPNIRNTRQEALNRIEELRHPNRTASPLNA